MIIGRLRSPSPFSSRASQEPSTVHASHPHAGKLQVQNSSGGSNLDTKRPRQATRRRNLLAMLAGAASLRAHQSQSYGGRKVIESLSAGAPRLPAAAVDNKSSHSPEVHVEYGATCARPHGR